VGVDFGASSEQRFGRKSEIHARMYQNSVGRTAVENAAKQQAILVILWEMFPESKYLLPAYFSPDPLLEKNKSVIKKPAAGREGLNIKIQKPDGTVIFTNEKAQEIPAVAAVVQPLNLEFDEDDEETSEDLLQSAYLGKPVYQEWQKPEYYSEHTPVISSWVVGDDPVGIIIREDKGLVTTRESCVIPHIVTDLSPKKTLSVLETLASFIPENWLFWKSTTQATPTVVTPGVVPTTTANSSPTVILPVAPTFDNTQVLFSAELPILEASPLQIALANVYKSPYAPVTNPILVQEPEDENTSDTDKLTLPGKDIIPVVFTMGQCTSTGQGNRPHG